MLQLVGMENHILIMIQLLQHFLEQEIASYNGDGFIWIISHAPFYGWGSGDYPANPGYPNSMKLANPYNARYKEILLAHPECIFVHGHTHISYEDKSKGLVIYAEPGEKINQGGCYSFHIGSGTRTKYLAEGGGSCTDRSALGRSQSIIADIYENGILMNCINDNSMEVLDSYYIVFKNNGKRVIKIYRIVAGESILVYEYTSSI